MKTAWLISTSPESANRPCADRLMEILEALSHVSVIPSTTIGSEDSQSVGVYDIYERPG